MVQYCDRITLTGEIESIQEKKICGDGKVFRSLILRVPRKSRTCDYLPVRISEAIFDRACGEYKNGIMVKGQLRSQTRVIGEHRKLILFCAADDVSQSDVIGQNEVLITGKIIKDPIYRYTPLGRQICDLLVEVSPTPYTHWFIPVIAWNTAARFASTLDKYSYVSVTGRFQSRNYEKVLEDGIVESLTAYELSCCCVKELV
ncbi:MAG TPA: single-stranded DNA-binding protein [Eubacteriales bacterium]|nr:single-stranded DNA-binding protein [Eubacteriales bacterium]